jgi:hypothetical protein
VWEVTAPAAQQPSWARQVTFALRISRGDLSAVTDTVAREMAAIDPALALANRQTMNEVVDRSLGWPRLLSVLASVFAVLAALLAAIGTYGLIAYAVGQRTWEFGVRMAMGADRAAVMRLVLAQGMTLAVAGIVLGGRSAIPTTHPAFFERGPVATGLQSEEAPLPLVVGPTPSVSLTP